MSQLANIEVKNLNHLGIIAGIIDEIGIVEIINEQLGIKPQEKLNNGIIVKSIILNALGFVSRPLYLFTQFFNDKATEHLFGEGIVAEDFNDDKIGRVMDKLYQFGLTKIFLLIALKALKEYGIEHKYSHLDSTSISLQGDYAVPEMKKSENLEPTPIKIVHGYSKDKRPDLKQFLINLIASGDGGIPLFLECGNGNDNDKAKFSQLLSNFKKQIDFDSIFVADSALYTADNLLVIEHLKWITRVPLSIKAAQFYVRETSDSEFIKTDREGYKAVEKESNYAGIKQKWIIIESKVRRKSDLKQLSKKILKDEEKANCLLGSLSQKKYENRTEIKAVFNCEQKKLKYHQLVLKDVAKITDKKSKKIVYKVRIVLEKKSDKIESEKKKAGRFILATNVLENLSPSDILTAYKGQQSCERGFRFLKDPLFFADSVFLKYPSRIETMAMLMGLSLLVYTIGQRQLRANLKQNHTGVKNQLGKLTEKPTLRWIFQCFQGIHLVVLNGVKQIVNLTDSRVETLNYFSKHCQKYYILSG
ncbi:IS1634 family transposase [Pleurocapsales cyanobacterium LEGE 10410]|nr:IS1634 family transposase [Pleurocapsales cyanobacterium LEGE 10410]